MQNLSREIIIFLVFWVLLVACLWLAWGRCEKARAFRTHTLAEWL